MLQYDLIVIGGGKGGKTLAVSQARAGRRVALIEKGMIGGSCINVACIPTKTLIQSAKVAELVTRAERFGIRLAFDGVEFASVRQRKDSVVSEMIGRNRKVFDSSGMDFVLGRASFSGLKEIEVTSADGEIRSMTADTIVVNTGTRPAVPAIPGLDPVRPLDSASIQNLDRLPEHLVILGGGVIGCEFAQLFRRLGSRVTMIDRNARFLPREEPEIGSAALGVFQEEGIEVRLGASFEAVAGQSGDSVEVSIRTASGEETIAGTHLLTALGRVPNTGELNAPATGLELDERGYVRVDEFLRTSVPGIWAIGDVTGGPQFTHASLDDYRIVAANLRGESRSTRNRLMPYTIFIDPELGRVGMTEAQARKAGHTVRVATLPAAAVPRAVTMGETQGLLKAVVDEPTDKILGFSGLCAAGGEVMAVVQMAIQGGLSASQVRDTVFSHPTMAEALGDLFSRLD
ncbi:MAG: mercuric reductase [Alphaproteobacteria bacterium]|nr:mercuric reductase [Alphaproteobacteria bacterium]